MERVSGGEIMKMAGRVFQEYFRGEQACREDLVAEGALGIVAGLEKYDPSRGVALTTYMCTCARNAMATYMKKERRSRQAIELSELDWVEAADVLDLERLAEEQRVAENLMRVREASGVLRPRANAIANELLMGRRQVDVARKYGVSRQDVNNVFKKIRARVTARYDYDGGQLVEKVVIDGEKS